MDDHGSKRDLAPVGEVLDDVLGRYAGAPTEPTSTVLAHWDEVAGPSWRRARPVRVTPDGVLLVEVPDGGLATRLRYESETLVAAIGRELGPGLVSSVRLRVDKTGGAS